MAPIGQKSEGRNTRSTTNTRGKKKPNTTGHFISILRIQKGQITSYKNERHKKARKRVENTEQTPIIAKEEKKVRSETDDESALEACVFGQVGGWKRGERDEKGQ